MFSKTYCPFCARAKALFEDLEVEHEVIELDERGKCDLLCLWRAPRMDFLTLFMLCADDGSKIQQILQDLTAQRSVPNVFINGKHIGGCDDLMALHASKKLTPLLK